jgi:hypothetical protein
MRKALRELYGLDGTMPQQYARFWTRLATGDFGPSLSAFPTPVSVLIRQSLPWTVGLLFTSTLTAWGVGNFLGGPRRLLSQEPPAGTRRQLGRLQPRARYRVDLHRRGRHRGLRHRSPLSAARPACESRIGPC